jgi:hypothetical protein
MTTIFSGKSERDPVIFLKMRYRLSILFAMGCALVHAQVVINEVCSRNYSVLADAFGEYPDWIELHNESAQPYDLGGHFLSDRPDDLAKWQFPAMTIPAGGYLVLFAGEGVDRFNFNISGDGELVYLSDPSLQPIDVLVAPELHNDHSYGRTNGGMRYFGDPTPGGINSTDAFLGYAPQPFIHPNSGVYTDPVEVEITSSLPSGQIVYTLDGRDPSETSAIYTEPIGIIAVTAVKAMVIADGLLPSRIVTSTFILAEHDLPVISLSTHPDSLFHEELGIYVMGPNADTVHPFHGANFWERRDIPVYFEYFENGMREVAQQVDLRIHGGSAARTKPQKPFRLIARDKYGSDRITHSFFDDPQTTEFKRLVLRNSGGDFCLAHFRDGLFHEMVRHHDLDVDVLGYSPAVAYINGEYWGILNLRERIDTDHLSIKYGIPEDEILLMQEEVDRSIQGDTVHFDQLREYIFTHDLNDPQHFQHVEMLLDMPSLIDYFVMEMYAGNVDWPANNVRFWKPSITEGKWRYLLYDLDATMEAAGYIPMNIDMFHWVFTHWADHTHSEILRSLLKNDEFKRGFVNRFADLMNTMFLPDSFQREVDIISDRIREEIPAHFDRWDQWLPAWNEHVEGRIATFAKVRPGFVRGHIDQHFQFQGAVDLTFDVFPAGSGEIHLNTIDPKLPFNGIYFNGNAIDLSVTPSAGHVFDHWEYSGDPSWYHGDPTLRRNFPKNGKITAVMHQSTDELIFWPNPTSGEVVFSFNNDREAQARITITDAAGRIVWETTRTMNEGTVVTQADLRDEADGLYVVAIEMPGRRVHSRFLKMAR